MSSPLARLAGSEPVASDDDLWQALFALKLPSSSVEEVVAASHAYCAEMVRNNPTSGNFQALCRRLIDLIYRVCRPKAPAAHVSQACGLTFLLRLFLKHMIETLDPEALASQLLDPTSSTSLAGPLVEALLTVVIQSDFNDASYWMHMEATAALTVCMSTQLFSALTDETPQPLVVALLTSGGPGAELLVSRLLYYVTSRPPPPAAPTGLLRRIGSVAKKALLLPYYTFSYFMYDADDGGGSLHLADRSLQLLLLLTQHLPPSLFPAESSPSNPFLEALRSIGDEQPFDTQPGPSEEGGLDEGGAMGLVDAEQGKYRASRVPYKELHDSLASQLPEQGAALLLYLLLHGNRDYLDYSLSRTDPETLLLPLLRVLHDSKSLPINRLYMLLILLLMLSQVHNRTLLWTSSFAPPPLDLFLWTTSSCSPFALPLPRLRSPTQPRSQFRTLASSPSPRARCSPPYPGTKSASSAPSPSDR